jgi:hypothetical protein
MYILADIFFTQLAVNLEENDLSVREEEVMKCVSTIAVETISAQ